MDASIPVRTSPHVGIYEFAGVRVDAHAYRLTRGDEEIVLEPKAFAVLLEFLAHPGEMLSRDALLDAVWGHRYVTPATLNRLIVLLRRALGDDPEAPRCIQTVHGKGYRFVATLADEIEAPATQRELRFAPPPAARVPARMSAIIGRDREVTDICTILASARLLCIVGAGGMGKTTVALEAARACTAQFADGIWFLDMSAPSGGAGAESMIATTFGVRGGSDEANRQHLIAMLAARCALLVLDNCERVAGELGEFVTRLLEACADIRILITSQRRLNCRGEIVYALPTLALPPMREWNSTQAIAELSTVASIQLLLARARALAAPFELTPANAASAAELCRRLDGMPFAIELAAVRLRVLDPAQLLERLNERFGWLAGNRRTERHQTLGLLLAWSFSLLDDEERRLLCALSVFAGSWTLDATLDFARMLEIDTTRVVDLLSGLADKSLLVIEPDHDPPRYRLLDSVRLYARLRLSEGRDEDIARGAHFAHLHKSSLLADAQARSARQHHWLEWMQRMTPDIESALAYASGQPEMHAAVLNLLGNLTWCMRTSGDYRRSTRWLDAAFALAPAESIDRARCHVIAGIIAHHRGEHPRSANHFRAGIDMARRFTEPHLAGIGCAMFAFELALCNRFEEAHALVADALAEAREHDDSWLRSLAFLGRGLIHARRGERRDAVADLATAAALVDRPEGEPFQLAYTLINLGLQQLEADLPGDAARTWLRTQLCMEHLWHWRGVAGCIEGAAYLAGLRGDHVCAARFLATAAHAREQTGAPLLEQWHTRHAAIEQAARDALGAEAFAAAQSEPKTRRIEEIAVETRDFLLGHVEADQLASANNPRGS